MKGKKSYYIPINLQYNKLNVDKYKLKHNSLLTLYIENNKSIYFQTDENDITHFSQRRFDYVLIPFKTL